jgi:hypothetical protein
MKELLNNSRQKELSPITKKKKEVWERSPEEINFMEKIQGNEKERPCEAW